MPIILAIFLFYFSLFHIEQISYAQEDRVKSFGSASVAIISKNYQTAIHILNEIFHSSSDIEERFDAAVLLFSFGPGTSAYDQRHEYGKFILSEYSRITYFSDSPFRDQLLKSLGVNRFSQGDWSLARSSFELLKYSHDISNRSFAELYLGWIDINENLFKKAINRWTSYLKSEGMRIPSVFKNSILRSLINTRTEPDNSIKSTDLIKIRYPSIQIIENNRNLFRGNSEVMVREFKRIENLIIDSMTEFKK